MSKIKKVAGWGAVAVLAIVIGGATISWQPEIAPLKQPGTQTFSPEKIEQGRKLADLGDCAVCHTRSGGERNTGGLAMEIPFGTIYSTNITPDVETGIGKWSFAAFKRAMRHGVDREGNYLYPAFPYTAFTRTSDADLEALYAYLMSQPPVKYSPPETALSFPFNIRQGIVTWNWLFLKPGELKTDSSKSAEWQRGEYLTEGLGHCSACHSPRNLMFGEKGGKEHLTGGVAEGWTAPSLVANSDAPLKWTHEDFVTFMRSGYSANHGVAAGPMGPVVTEGLSQLPAEDVKAIATYLMSFQSDSAPQGSAAELNQRAESKVEPLTSEGARLFSGSCMACHAQEKGPQMAGVRPSLALNTNLFTDSPENAIRIVLDGIQHPAKAELGFMPAFRHNLSDAQIATLLNYLREEYAGKAAWPDLQHKVSEVRAETAVNKQ